MTLVFLGRLLPPCLPRTVFVSLTYQSFRDRLDDRLSSALVPHPQVTPSHQKPDVFDYSIDQ